MILFAAAGIALVVWRRPAAYWQGMTMGGRMPPGCAIAEGIALIVLAILIFVMRRAIH